MNTNNYEDIKSREFTQKDLMQYLLHSTQHTATREELQEAKLELKENFAGVRSDLKGDIANFQTEFKETRIELKEDIAGVRVELKEDIANLQSELKETRSDLKGDIADVRSELKEEKNILRKDISKLSDKFDRLTWFILTAVLTLFFKDYILGLFAK